MKQKELMREMEIKNGKIKNKLVKMVEINYAYLVWTVGVRAFFRLCSTHFILCSASRKIEENRGEKKEINLKIKSKSAIRSSDSVCMYDSEKCVKANKKHL